MNYEQTYEWKSYCELMQEHPEVFRNTGNIDIVADIRQVTTFVEKTGKKIGVIYQSEYSLWVVDLIKGADGTLFTYERLIQTAMQGAVVVIPCHAGKYILLKQYRHALHDYQYAFPRGFGEDGITSEKNAVKEVAEELGAVVTGTTYLGKIVADSGYCGNAADVYLCDITEPKCKEGYEGIKEIYALEEAELKQWMKDGKITDGFSLAAWALLRGGGNGQMEG